jgi:tRNA (guanine37-N1)-methyltransferase
MQAEPIFRCYEALCRETGAKPHLVYMSPQGKTLTQQRVRELAGLPNLVLLCGHYEGVDERVLETIVDEEISIGDYVLTGGELAALVVTDSVARMLPGVLADEVCFTDESHYAGLLEYPQYTRPAVWREQPVPQVLLNGDHGKIAQWRAETALERTRQKRPDLLQPDVQKESR